MPLPNYTSWQKYTGGYRKSDTVLGLASNFFRAAVTFNRDLFSASISTWESLQNGFIETNYQSVTNAAITSRVEELPKEDKVKLAESLIQEFMFPQVIRDFHAQAAKDQDNQYFERYAELEEQRNTLIQQASMRVKNQLVGALGDEQCFLQAMQNIKNIIPTDLLHKNLKTALHTFHEEQTKAKAQDTKTEPSLPKASIPISPTPKFNWRMFGFIIISVLGLGLPLLALISKQFRNWVTRVGEKEYADSELKSQNISEHDDGASQPATEHKEQTGENPAPVVQNSQNHSHGGNTFFQQTSENTTQKVNIDDLEQTLSQLLMDAGISNSSPEYSAHLIALYAKRNLHAANPAGEVVIHKVNGKFELSINMDEPQKYLTTMHKTGKIGSPDIVLLTRNAKGNFTLTIDITPEQIDLNRSFKPKAKNPRNVNRVCRFEFEPGSKVKQPFGESNQAEIKRFIKETEAKIPHFIKPFVNAENQIRSALSVAPEVTDVTEESFFKANKELRFCITAAKLKRQGREMTDGEVNAYIKNMEDSYYWLKRFAHAVADLSAMNTPMEYTNVVTAQGAPVLTQVLIMSSNQDWQYRKGERGKSRTPIELKQHAGQSICPADLKAELKEKALTKQVNFCCTIGTDGVITTLEPPNPPTLTRR